MFAGIICFALACECLVRVLQGHVVWTVPGVGLWMAGMVMLDVA